MPLPELTAFIEQIRAAAPEYDWKPKVAEPVYNDRKLKTCAAVEIPEPSTSLDEARFEMRDAMRRYIEDENPDHVLLVRALPGTGKTQAAAELVDELIAAGHRVGYAGPRHDFFEDVVEKSDDPSLWYEWQPRQLSDPDNGKPETCRYTPQINTWMIRGYEAMDFCSGVCGWNYVKTCPFHKQKERREPVLFIQHQHVTLGHPVDFSVVIGDESPLSAFIRDWEIPARWVMPPGMDMTEPIAEILARLSDICGRTDRVVSGNTLYTGLGGPESVLSALKGSEIPLDALGAAEIHVAEDAGNAPYFHLPSLGALMARECQSIIETGDCVQRVLATPGALRLLLRRKPSERLPRHVIWLDATGKPEIYEQLFGRPVRVFNARPKMHGKIYQVVDRANGKSAIKPSRGKKNMPLPDDHETLHAKQAKTIIEKVVDAYGYTSPAVISYKGLDFGEIDQGHFYASRGTNAHEKSDALFVLGTPQPSIFEVVKMAKMIYFERDRPFDTTWYTRDMAYAYNAPDGMGRCYPISGFWSDMELHAVLMAFRDDEIVQAAHRGRPVNHETDIWLLTNLPIFSLPPDELLTMREIMGAPLGVDIWKWQIIKQLIEAGEPFGVAELIEAGLSRKTASEYIDACEPPPGWRRGFLPPRGGRPPKGLLPK